MSYSLLICILLTLLFSAFFSGMEMAFISADRIRLELDKQEGGWVARILQYFYNHSERFISTMLVGNNIALIIYGILMAQLMESPIREYISENDFIVVLTQTVFSTIIILFTAEYLPKTLFKMNPNMMLRIFAVPLWLIYWILSPISLFSTMLSHGILRLFGMPIIKEKQGELTRVDLDFFVQKGIENADDDDEKDDTKNHSGLSKADDDDNLQELQLFKNVLDFSEVKVRDCMIPRSELTAVSIDTPFKELNQLFVETGYSKIPVYKEDIDNLIGYIHSSEMFRRPHQWQQKIIPILFVPESMAAPKLLRMLMEHKKSIAAVVDEFGGTAGVITTEDLFEEIIGDIEDEHDQVQLIENKVNDHEWELSGRLEISHINEDLELNLPESDEYQTLAGLILHHLQTMPKVGDTITLDDEQISLTVVKTSATKIELVKLSNLPSEE
ncbi:MAG: HlyC/CorC family transporter [Bacteroidales bacterium]|nr:HlyC/CorC family transporter [Bacteroidales bacterium]